MNRTVIVDEKANIMKGKSNMKNTLLKTIWMAFVLTASALNMRGQDAERSTRIADSAKITSSPEFRMFLEHYVAAINAKDQQALKECIHPKSVELIEKDSAVSNDCFWIRLNNPSWSKIEANYTVLVTPVPADKPLPFAQFVTYPVRPSHLMHLEWHDPINTMKSRQIEDFIVMERDKWFVVITTRPSKNLSVQGGSNLSEGNNMTEYPNALVSCFVNELVTAIQNTNEAGIRVLMHPKCVDALKTNVDAQLFLKYLLDQKITTPCTWKAKPLTNKTSAIFSINRFILPPQAAIDLMWKTKDASTAKEKSEIVTICVTKEGDALVIVPYMNDYLAKQIKDSNKSAASDRK